MPNCVARVWRVAEIGANFGYGKSKKKQAECTAIPVVQGRTKTTNFDNLGEIAP